MAVALLARRDYSRQQIRDKLLDKGFELNDIEPVLDACESSGFINDARYAELLVRSHISRGHGAIRIRQAIAQKGLSKDCIETALVNCDCDWFELAKDKATKKYGVPRVTEVKGSKARELIAKEKAKRVRFLMGQGFSYDQISYALDSDPNDLDEDD
ncbi:regulatory protein RecX [Shewanella putrefaciens]|uniref:regulatory protein RecX n=1 Tax=Shewanella putrefaciens TaxID=24 RepID=UPI0035A5A1F2